MVFLKKLFYKKNIVYFIFLMSFLFLSEKVSADCGPGGDGCYSYWGWKSVAQSSCYYIEGSDTCWWWKDEWVGHDTCQTWCPTTTTTTNTNTTTNTTTYETGGEIYYKDGELYCCTGVGCINTPPCGDTTGLTHYGDVIKVDGKWICSNALKTPITPVVDDPSDPVPINGACGSSSGQSYSSAPTTNLCSAGSLTWTDGVGSDGDWNWTCSGSNGGTNASCSANITVINGTCGSSNGQTFTSAPTTNLCSAGATSVVSGSGPWSWTCSGSGGGSTASCSAVVSPLSVSVICPSQAQIGQTVEWSSTVTGGVLPYSYTWTGDWASSTLSSGTNYSSSSASYSKAFGFVDNYTATLTIVDGAGTTRSDSDIVNVEDNRIPQ